MQMYEAAAKALEELHTPSHVRELHQYMEKQAYFHFGAQDPGRALAVCLDRHSKGVTISRPSAIQLFYRHGPSTYGLLAWLDERTAKELQDEEDTANEEREQSLDCSLFLEEDWHKWLFNNLKQNGLAALGFGKMTLFDVGKQEQRNGKYNTTIVGEIEILLTTEGGDFVVLELKRSGDDETVGQICRYVGWVKETLATKGQRVHGVILAARISSRLRYAIKAVNENIHYQQVVLSVEFGESSRA